MLSLFTGQDDMYVAIYGTGRAIYLYMCMFFISRTQIGPKANRNTDEAPQTAVSGKNQVFAIYPTGRTFQKSVKKVFCTKSVRSQHASPCIAFVKLYQVT